MGNGGKSGREPAAGVVTAQSVSLRPELKEIGAGIGCSNDLQN